MKQKILALLLMPVLILGCGFDPGTPPPTPVNEIVSANPETAQTSSDGIFTLTSPDVTEGGALPKEFTCDGASATRRFHGVVFLKAQ